MNKTLDPFQVGSDYLLNPRGIALQPSDKLHFILRGRSKTRRYYDVYVVRGNDLMRVTQAIAYVSGFRYDRHKEALVDDTQIPYSVPGEVAYRTRLNLFPDAHLYGNGMPYEDHC